jgi:hypothetical protein
MDEHTIKRWLEVEFDRYVQANFIETTVRLVLVILSLFLVVLVLMRTTERGTYKALYAGIGIVLGLAYAFLEWQSEKSARNMWKKLRFVTSDWAALGDRDLDPQEVLRRLHQK